MKSCNQLKIVGVAAFWAMLLFSLAVPAIAGNISGPAAAFPDKAADWERKEKPVQVAGEELFTLINGGAEVYLRLGFKQAASVAFAHTSGKDIQVEIYEMKDAGAAKAAFERMAGGEKPNLDLGAGAFLADYYLLVHSGPYFISLAGTDSDVNTVKGLKLLGESILANLP